MNIMESAQELYEKGLKFSENAKKDLEVLGQAVEDIVNTAYEVFDTQDMKLAEKIEPLEEVIDELSKEVKRRHVQRLRNGECTIEMGFILSDITTCLERVADHCSNIGVCVTQVNEDLYDTHSHLNTVKTIRTSPSIMNWKMHGLNISCHKKTVDDGINGKVRALWNIGRCTGFFMLLIYSQQWIFLIGVMEFGEDTGFRLV